MNISKAVHVFSYMLFSVSGLIASRYGEFLTDYDALYPANESDITVCFYGEALAGKKIQMQSGFSAQNSLEKANKLFIRFPGKATDEFFDLDLAISGKEQNDRTVFSGSVNLAHGRHIYVKCDDRNLVLSQSNVNIFDQSYLDKQKELRLAFAIALISKSTMLGGGGYADDPDYSLAALHYILSSCEGSKALESFEKIFAQSKQNEGRMYALLGIKYLGETEKVNAISKGINGTLSIGDGGCIPNKMTLNEGDALKLLENSPDILANLSKSFEGSRNIISFEIAFMRHNSAINRD